MPQFKIGSAVYTAAALDRLSLRNLIRLERETTELGRPMRWAELRSLADRVSDLPEDQIETDDDFPWFLGMLIWAARLDAGEDISFTDAIDFPLADLEIIPEPGDEVRAPDPRRARPASGRADARRPADRKAKAPKGSKTPSTVD